MGRHPRQALARREPGDAHADRHAAGLDDGAGGIAGEADGDPLAAQSQRPGHHAEQQAEECRRPQAGADQTARRQGEGGRRAADVCHDVPARHPRDVDSLLARLGRHQSGQGRQPDHHPAGADGGQHESGQDGRLLRRRAVEQPRHRGRHRLHRHHHAADVEGPPREGVRVHRRIRDEESEDGESRSSRRCIWRACISTISATAPRPPKSSRRPTYINCPPAIILERLLGKYEYGDGRVGAGSELHDLLAARLQLSAPDLRQVVADAAATLGTDQRRARLRRHPEARASARTSISRP